MGRRLAVTRERATIIGGCAVIGAGFAAVASAPVFAVALAGMGTAGLAEGTVGACEQGILQRRAPTPSASRATAGQPEPRGAALGRGRAFRSRRPAS